MASIHHAESPEGAQRRERAAIAAQACQTCRNRKSKCDEKRPKCGLCQRLGIECLYREPLPTKKDKTMVHILDTLTRLENKFDSMVLTGGSASGTPDGGIPTSSHVSSHPSLKGFRSDSDSQMDFPSEMKRGYQHVTAPHKVILWPSIYIHLVNSGIKAAGDLQHVLQEGTPWFIKQEMAKHPEPLSHEVCLPSYTIHQQSRERGFAANVIFPTLTIQQVNEFTDAYFNTFNILFPLLNRDSFSNDVLSPIMRDGYGDGDANSVLALLVLALGQLAIEGVFHNPINHNAGKPSGFRGGTVDRPPGLEIFNEARRRLGFVVSSCSLVHVQILLLHATYFEANARHLDFWRSTVQASMAIQVLVKCKAVDWSTSEGDLIKRAYWACILSEDFYHLDLDLPQTGIHLLDDEVPLPYFHDAQDMTGNLRSEEPSHFQYHFLAMIALRRLIARIHHVIHEASNSQAESSEDYGGPPVTVIREMARQLESWRSLLPRAVQWSDNDMHDFPGSDPNHRRPNEPLFALDQGNVPINHKFNLDIMTAQLRTRFYYARFMIYRPYVYKALHFPELMGSEDSVCAGLAIKSACMWPLAMAPPKNKKRLVPHLFAWTQNFLGMLLIFRMINVSECLTKIVDEQVGREDVQHTIALMLDWMRDMKQLDGIADWSWRILEPLFRGQATGM